MHLRCRAGPHAERFGLSVGAFDAVTGPRLGAGREAGELRKTCGLLFAPKVEGCLGSDRIIE